MIKKIREDFIIICGKDTDYLRRICNSARMYIEEQKAYLRTPSGRLAGDPVIRDYPPWARHGIDNIIEVVTGIDQDNYRWR